MQLLASFRRPIVVVHLSAGPRAVSEGSSSEDRSSHGEAPPRFATTSWSMIATARGEDSRAGSALEELCHAYWYPLYAYLRRSGKSREDSEDLTQGFLASLFSNNRLQLADAERGRFRTFLLSSLDHFVIGQWRRETAQKRGGGQRPVSIDFSLAEERYGIEPVDRDTPQQHFDRLWAMELLGQVIALLEEEYRVAGKEELFSALAPLIAATDQGAVSAIAEKLSMSVGAVRVALHRLRQRYRQRLRDLVERTLLDGQDVDEEIQELFRALG